VVCSKGVADLTYDAENRLARVSGGASASFVYDGDGQRVAQTINDVTTYFIGNYYEVTNGVVTKYYYAGGQRIALRQNGTLYYLLSDHLGSTTLVTDASGNIVSELRYKPWGETRHNSGSTPTRYQYTGQYSYTPDFGLYFYNARWYDPALGRFAQPDSLIPESSQGAQAWDRYAYVNNNPLKYTDPSGHWLETAWDILNIAWDIQAIRQDPGNLWNWGALVVDVGTALLPGVPAFAGVVSKGGKAAKAAVEVASHADEVVDVGKLGTKAAEALKAVERVENASDALRGVNPAVIGEVSERGAEQAARGGTYKLIDPVTGEVQYVGRTKDLARRQAEHRRDPLKEQFRFEIDWRTDDYAVQRGREQMLYDQYRPPLNRIRPISPRNPRLQAYLEAAKRFGERMR